MIKSLTSLRGIFILFIFFHHCMNIYPGGGSMAVVFFFVLGGFGLTLGYKEKIMKPDFSYRQYIFRRIIKFYPLHWLCLVLTLPLVGFYFSIKQGALFATNAALLHTLFPVRVLYFSYNKVSWYLADTLFFALLFPLIMRWIIRSSTKGKAAIASIFTVFYIIVAISIPKEQYHAILYISPYIRLTDFVFGIYLALVFERLKAMQLESILLRNQVISSFLILVFVTSLVVESCLLPEIAFHFAPVYWFLIAVLILFTFLSESSGGGKFLKYSCLQMLGNLSFTIFMTHQLILRYSKKIFSAFHFDNSILYVILTLCLTILVSYLIDRYLLNPITQWLTKKIQPSMIVR